MESVGFVKKFMAFCFILPISGIDAYHQDDYNIKLDRIVAEDFSRNYLRTMSVGLFWFNRTSRVCNVNATLIKDLEADFKVDLQVYKFLSNEFRFFPITMTLYGCKEVQRDIFGLLDVIHKSSNLPLLCPPEKGCYSLRHMVFDFSKFPPYIPRGSYKVEAKVYNKNDFVTTIYVVGSVEDKPLKIFS